MRVIALCMLCYITLTHGFAFIFAIMDCLVQILGMAGIIKDIPDHATFREKMHSLGWLDKLGIFLYFSICNWANFDLLYLSKYK